MEETRTGGTKEFVFSVLWAAVMLFIGNSITALFASYKIIGVICTIILFCILGFFVLTRYSAIYTYTLKNDRLRVVRKIGHRVKTVDISISSVKNITRVRPADKVKHTRSMRKTVFSQKCVCYLVYEQSGEKNLLIFEPSNAMMSKIKGCVGKSKV